MFGKIRIFFTHSARHSIAAGALIVSFFGIASRFLGLIRDRILASHYGAGDVLDVYYAAFRLPDLVFELLIVGSLGAAFVPVFTKLTAKKDWHDAWEYVSGMLVTVVLGIAVFAVCGVFFAPQFVHFIVPGFPEEKMILTTHLVRIMFLSPIFLTASAILGSVLVSFRQFIFYSMAPLFYNCGIIIGAVFFVPYCGISGLAWGVVFGSFLHFCTNFIAASVAGFRFSLLHNLFFRNPYVKKTIYLMLPRMFTSTSNQISLLLTTFFASALAAGSITIVTFATNIQSVVLGLIGIPFSLAAFPVLSKKFATGKMEEFVGVFSQTLRRILYYAVPLSVIFFILREQLVRVIYGAGHFDIEDTILTYNVLGILCISLFAQSIIPLLARGFYAMQNTKTPFYIALAAQVVNVVVIFFFIRSIGVYAIACGFSCAAIVNALILFFIFHRRVHGHEYNDTMRTILQILIASFVVVITTHFVRNLAGELLPLQYVWGVLVQLVVSCVCGGVTYLFITAIFEMREYETIKKKIIIRIFGRPQVATEQQNIIR